MPINDGVVLVPAIFIKNVGEAIFDEDHYSVICSVETGSKPDLRHLQLIIQENGAELEKLMGRNAELIACGPGSPFGPFRTRAINEYGKVDFNDLPIIMSPYMLTLREE